MIADDAAIAFGRFPELGFVNIQSNGNFTLYRALTTSGAAVPSASSFSHTNTKGLPDDWLVVYAK